MSRLAALFTRSAGYLRVPTSSLTERDLDLEQDPELEPEITFGFTFKPSPAAASDNAQRWKRTRVTIGRLVALGLAAIGILVLVVLLWRRFAESIEDAPMIDGNDVKMQTNNDNGNDHDSDGDGDWTASLDPTLHHVFRLSDLPRHPNANATHLLRASRFLPEENDCLEQWFANGEICQTGSSSPLGEEEQIDLIYTWVNGSDPVWRAAQDLKATEALQIVGFRGEVRIGRPPDEHYRDGGGFQYVIRSAVQSFAKTTPITSTTPSHIRKIHVLSADTPVGDDRQDSRRIGQIPNWLDKDNPVRHDLTPALQWHFHSEVFHSGLDFHNNSQQGQAQLPNWESEDEWNAAAYPSFNSFAIESRIGWLDDLSEVCVQSNDDMYFLASLSVADFHSPIFGSVLRLDDSKGLQVKPIIQHSKVADSGEWGALQHANSLLSRRFPKRPRQYINHLPKTITAPILHEISIMFANDIATASARPFRESSAGQGDIEFAFLSAHARIERWREALLWTWVVANVGQLEGEGGQWGDKARQAVFQLLGPSSLKLEEAVVILKTERSTLSHIEDAFDRAGWERPKQTRYIFSSMDGHLPRNNGGLGEDDNDSQCRIHMEKCFGDFITGSTVSASNIFKHLAFDQWSCGDCLISALVSASGSKGLSAFLPDPAVTYHPVRASVSTPTPSLPLTDDWTRTDFAIDSVIITPDPVNLRTWTLQLLSRYLYVAGDTSQHFSPLHSSWEARVQTGYIDDNPNIALACLNDNFPEKDARKASMILTDWMKRKWSGFSNWWET